MRVALAKSKNVVSVRLLRAVGLDNVVEYLPRFGFDKAEIPKDETVSLGSGAHTPLEVATAMSVIANGGFLIEPHFIQRIEDEYGLVIWQANPSQACDPCTVSTEPKAEIPEDDIEAQLAAEFALPSMSNETELESNSIPQAPRVISEDNAFLVAEMMRSAVQINGHWDDRGTGWRTALLLKRNDVAGKTGTTNDVRDTWFTGFTPNLVATAWVGFDDNNRRLGRTSVNQNLVNKNPQKFNYIGNAMIGSEAGAIAAQPAWIRFMQFALDGKPEHTLPMPSNVVKVRIDKRSGKLTDRTDSTSMFEYFAQGTQPEVYAKGGKSEQLGQDGESGSQQLEDIF
jgi:penicillin-binding protein 1A